MVQPSGAPPGRRSVAVLFSSPMAAARLGSDGREGVRPAIGNWNQDWINRRVRYYELVILAEWSGGTELSDLASG